MTFNDLPATLRAKIASGVRWYLTREEFPLMLQYLRDTKAAVAGFDVDLCMKLLTPPEGFPPERRVVNMTCPVDFSQPPAHVNFRCTNQWLVDQPRLERGSDRQLSSWDKLRDIFGGDFVTSIRETAK